MSLIRIDHQPSRRQLAVFGALWLVFFGIVGEIVFSKTGSVAAGGAVWAAGILVPIIGWTVPAMMRIVYLGTAYAALPIGLVVSYVILAISYYLVLTPTGLLMRLFGHDPMRRRFDPGAETYWVARKPEDDVRRYFRQF